MFKRQARILTLVSAASFCLGLAALETSIGLGSGAQVASAETVEARRTASVYASPGEKSRVVTRVRPGMELKVLSRDGRFIKVRVNGRTGWIARSNVEQRQARTKVRKNRRRAFVEGRSRKRGGRKAAPRDRVGADAVEDAFLDEEEFSDEEELPEDEDFEDGEENPLDDGEEEEVVEEEPEQDTVVALAATSLRADPDAEADEVADLDKGQTLYVLERDGEWIKVENDQGDVGWVMDAAVGGGGYQYEKWDNDVYAGLGFQFLGQTFTSNGAGNLAQYQISSNAIVLGLGGELYYPYSDKIILAGDLGASLAKASPGIKVAVGDMASEIGFTSYQVDLGVRGGYVISEESGLAGYLRLGYHWEKFGVANVNDFETTNIAYLPSEILTGFMVGVLVDMPSFQEKWRFRGGVDLLLGAKRTQTRGLEDGATSSAGALRGLLRADYRFRPNLDITASYQLFQAKTQWAGTVADSMRPHLSDGTAGAERKDLTHTIFVGAARSF